MKVCVRGTSGVKGVTYLCAVARHGDKQKHDSGPNESKIRKSGSGVSPEIHIAQSAALRAGPEQAVESAEARSINALNRSGELVRSTGACTHSQQLPTCREPLEHVQVRGCTRRLLS